MIPKIDRSSIPGIRGFNSVYSLLICTAFTLLALVNKNNATLQPPTKLTASIFFLGCFICILLIRCGSLLTALIQPPIIVTACTGFFYWHTIKQSHNQKLITIGMSLAQFFPVLSITCLIIAIIALIRWLGYRRVDILATPTKNSSKASIRCAYKLTPQNSSQAIEPERFETKINDSPVDSNSTELNIKNSRKVPSESYRSSRSNSRVFPKVTENISESPYSQNAVPTSEYQEFSPQSYARYLARTSNREQRITSYHENRQQRYSRQHSQTR